VCEATAACSPLLGQKDSWSCRCQSGGVDHATTRTASPYLGLRGEVGSEEQAISTGVVFGRAPLVVALIHVGSCPCKQPPAWAAVSEAHTFHDTGAPSLYIRAPPSSSLPLRRCGPLAVHSCIALAQRGRYCRAYFLSTVVTSEQAHHAATRVAYVPATSCVTASRANGLDTPQITGMSRHSRRLT